MLRFALLLLAAIVAGELVQRWLALPRIVGYVAAGFALGPNAAALIGQDSLIQLRPLLDAAIGLVLFELGQRIDLGWLKRNPWLLASSVAEAALSFAAIYLVLWLLDVRPLLAATMAAIGVSTSPAVVLAVGRDLRAQGQVTERLMMLTALNSVYAFVAVSMLFAWLQAEYHGDWRTILLHPLYLIFGSLLLAVVAAALTLMLLERLGKREDAQFVAILTLVLGTVALAAALKLPVVLSLLAFGALTRSLDGRRRFISMSFGKTGLLFVAILFALSGASVTASLLPSALFVAVVLIAARFAGKAIGVFMFSTAAALSLRKASLLSIGLLPMSSLAVVMVHDTAKRFPEVGSELAVVMLTAVAILELFGPLATRFAIRRAGEAGEGGR